MFLFFLRKLPAPSVKQFVYLCPNSSGPVKVNSWTVLLYSMSALTESTVSAASEMSDVETSIVKQTASGDIVVSVVI
jgi:hypothetical protein